MCPALAHVASYFDVSLIHFDVSLLSQVKPILGLVDLSAHASAFECVRLCSEGKIMRIRDIWNPSKLI